MDAEFLMFLIRGGHINMTDRIERGFWPHPPLQFAELRRLLAKTIEEQGYFPARFPGRSQLRGDGVIIERDRAGRFEVHFYNGDPANINVVNHYSMKRCSSAEEAADAYLRSALFLPGDLDGWKVEA